MITLALIGLGAYVAGHYIGYKHGKGKTDKAIDDLKG